MARSFSQTTVAYAAERGIPEEDLPLIINGCSGGLSWLYALGGKSISCEECCNRHDIDYQLGGTAEDRREADRRLRECATDKAGGYRWKRFRAWVMWGAVRVFGAGYWE